MRSGETTLLGTSLFDRCGAGEFSLANDVVFFELAAKFGAKFFGKLVGLVLHGDLDKDVGSHRYTFILSATPFRGCFQPVI